MRQSKSLGSLVPGTGALKRKAGTSSSSGGTRELYFPAAADAYELLDDCGRGAAATVWRARCLTNNEIVAVKILNLEAQMAPLEDIVHEAQTMKAYKHEAVLGLHVCFVHDTQLWMVMPYMEGGSVAHIMRYRYPDGLQEPMIATIMKEVLSALAYIHSNGDIHRDVKAGNILVDGDGHVKLGDFGVAASMERQDWGAPQGRNTFAGTPCWMAPEVLEQDRYGPKADIWSAGITMLELVHGHAPFSKLPPIKVLLLTLQGPPPQLEAECGGRHFSRGMREVVASCLNKDPAKRPTAKQLLSKGFFRQAKDAEYLKRTILAGLPPLPQRVMEIRMGKGRAATLASQNDRAAMASHISYITDVAQWDFNCTRSTTGTADSGGSLLPPGAAAAAPGGLPELPSNAVSSSSPSRQAGSVDGSPSKQAGSRDDQQLEQPHSHQQQQLQAGQAGAAGPAASALGSSNSLDVPGHQQQQGVVGLDGFMAAAQQQQVAAAGDAGPGSRDVDTGGGAADTDRVAAAAAGGAASAAEAAEKVPSPVRQLPPQSARTASPAAAAARGGGSPAAAASAAAQAKVLTCTLGGRTISTFPVSVPDTPDHSPMHSRPNTPELRAAEAAAAAAAADGGRLARGHATSFPGAAAADTHATGGGAAAVAGAKKHGRFTYVEGSSRYQGPDLASDGSPKAAAAAGAGAPGGPGLGAGGGRGYELVKQRSVSSPDMALLMSLQAAGAGSAAAAAGATAAGSSSLSDMPLSPVSPASPASSAAAAAGAPASAALSSSAGLSPRQQQQQPAEAGMARPSSPAAGGSSSSLLAKLLPHKQTGDAVSPRRPQSPVSPAQQQQHHEHHEHHLLPHKLAGFLAHHGLGKASRGASPLSSRDASPRHVSRHGGSAHDGGAGAAAGSSRSSRVQSSDSLAAAATGPTMPEAGGSSAHGGAAMGSLSRAGASLQEVYPERSDAAKSPRSHSPRPAAAGAHSRPGAGHKEHATAGQIWQHVKEACAETASDVAHIFRSRSGGSLHQHADRSHSRSPERPPSQQQEQQQQQQPLSPPSPRPTAPQPEANGFGEVRQQQQQPSVAEPPGVQPSSSTADASKHGSSSAAGAAPASSGGPAAAAVGPTGGSSSNLVRLGSRGSIPAVSLADIAAPGGSSSSSSSKPPRYQQGPTRTASKELLLKQPLSPPRQPAQQQQQQQQAVTEAPAGAKQQQIQQELQQLQQQPGIPEEDTCEAAAAVTTLAAAAQTADRAAAAAAAADTAPSTGFDANGHAPQPQAGGGKASPAAPGVAKPLSAAAAAQASSTGGSSPGLSELASRELSFAPGLDSQPSSGSASGAAAVAADRLSSHALADSPEKQQQQQGDAHGPLGQETSVTFSVAPTRGVEKSRAEPRSPQQQQDRRPAQVQGAPAPSAAAAGSQARESAEGGTTLLELRGVTSSDSDMPTRGRPLLTAADAAAGAPGGAAHGQQQQLQQQQARVGSEARAAHTSASPSRRHKGRFTITET